MSRKKPNPVVKQTVDEEVAEAGEVLAARRKKHERMDATNEIRRHQEPRSGRIKYLFEVEEFPWAED
jgi:hypothetical protein